MRKKQINEHKVLEALARVLPLGNHVNSWGNITVFGIKIFFFNRQLIKDKGV